MNWLEIQSKWLDMTCRAQGIKPSALRAAALTNMAPDMEQPKRSTVSDMAAEATSVTSLANLRVL